MANVTNNCSQLIENTVLNADIIASVAILPTLLTIIGNAIFLVTFIKTKSLHTPSNLMLAALCVADLMLGLIYEPTVLVYLFHIRYGYNSRVFHILYYPFFDFFAVLSGTYFFFITLDRYVAICYPFWYRRHITCKRYLIVTVLIPGILLTIFVIGAATQNEKPHDFKGSSATALGIVVAVTLLVVLMYSRIYKVASKQANRVVNIGTFEGDEENEEIQQWTRERKKAYTVAIVLGIWIATNLPFAVEQIFILTRHSARHSAFCFVDLLKFDMWARFFTALNSFANPFVYCYRSEEIRKAAFKIFWPKQGE